MSLLSKGNFLPQLVLGDKSEQQIFNTLYIWLSALLLQEDIIAKLLKTHVPEIYKTL